MGGDHKNGQKPIGSKDSFLLKGTINKGPAILGWTIFFNRIVLVRYVSLILYNL
jgi:hypothetical protein